MRLPLPGYLTITGLRLRISGIEKLKIGVPRFYLTRLHLAPDPLVWHWQFQPPEEFIGEDQAVNHGPLGTPVA